VRGLPLRRLEFQPVRGTHARPLRTVGPFRDDTLDVERRAGFQQFTRPRVERADRAPTRTQQPERLERDATLLTQQAFPIAILVVAIVMIAAPFILQLRVLRNRERDLDGERRKIINDDLLRGTLTASAWAPRSRTRPRRTFGSSRSFERNTDATCGVTFQPGAP